MNYYEGTWAGPKIPPNGYTVAEFEEALDRMLELINQYNLDRRISITIPQEDIDELLNDSIPISQEDIGELL